MQYEFCSLRGNNFRAEGNTPEEAWENLVEQEKNEGSLWRCNDYHCNRHAVQNGRFKCLISNDYWQPVYREVS